MTVGRLALVCSVAAIVGVARAKPAAKTAAEPKGDVPTVDVAPVKDKLAILGDGKGHYVALVPFDDGGWTHAYYGDGKAFYALRVIGSGAVGHESFDFTFWDPRVKARYLAGLELKGGKYEVTCDTRKTELQPLPKAEADAMIAAATFHAPLWRFRAFALARDDHGIYYYVDRQREPEDSLNFRLFSGPRGALKPLKMTNVVSDSEGQIFSTKTGDLRLVLDRKEAAWVKGKARTTLVPLPIEDNAQLIYTDLGAYTGQRLGTPCDDF
ncbi:MAG TPA: hypothetical protein VHJ20_23080 [Polyangia bacterium]|nr:hypothetical protein [Polyangia bacterium]